MHYPEGKYIGLFVALFLGILLSYYFWPINQDRPSQLSQPEANERRELRYLLLCVFDLLESLDAIAQSGENINSYSFAERCIDRL